MPEENAPVGPNSERPTSNTNPPAPNPGPPNAPGTGGDTPGSTPGGGTNAGGTRNPDEARPGGQNLITGQTGSAAPRTSEPHPAAPSDLQSELDASIPRTEEPAEYGEPEVMLLRERLGGSFRRATTKSGRLYVILHKDAIVEALTLLRDEAGYDYFCECVGFDYSKWNHERDTDERFEVVYNVMNVARGRRLMLKLGVADGESVPTAKGVFLGAEFPEKEIRDLFGIPFEGNSFLPGTRFLLPDDWVGFPLRKEVPLGGEDVLFDRGTRGPAVEDRMMPHAGESFEGRTGSEDVAGR